MSYYRRGYSWENIQYLPAPVGGWNADANPWEMPENQAPQLDNFLIRPGRIVARGGFRVERDFTASAPVAAMGGVIGLASNVVPEYPTFLVGRLTSTSAQFVSNVDAPALRLPASTNLARGTGTGLFYNAATVTQSAPAMQPTIGWRWVNFDGLLYGIAADDLPGNATAQDANATYTVWKTKMLTMPLTNPAAPTITAQTAAPQGAFDIAGYQSRIWLLGGVDTPGAGTTHSCTTLFFTNPGVSGVGSASADWKDPVSGLTNQIKMDNNVSDYGVGFAKVRSGLLVFRKRSIWLLRGSTTDSYTLVQVSTELGCADARSIVETDSGVYFLSHRGLMRTDGVRVYNESGSIEHLLIDAIQYEQTVRGIGLGQGDWNVGTGYECCQLTASGDIFVAIGAGPAQNVAKPREMTPLLSALYSPSTRTWTRITSQLWGNEMQPMNSLNYYSPQLMTNLTGVPTIYAIGDKYLTQLDSIGGGALSEPTLSSQGVGALFDWVGTTFFSIPMLWKTRYMPIVGTSTQMRKYGQAKRIFLDYLFQCTGSAPSIPANGWTVTPIDGTGAALAGSGTLVTPVTAGGAGTFAHGFLNVLSGTGTNPGFPGLPISRQNLDVTSELSDVAFSITAPVLNPTGISISISTLSAELFGIGIEYQPGRDLR